MELNSNKFMATIIITCTTFLYIIFSFLRKRKRSRMFALPPSPPRLPIIGHLHLITHMPHYSFSELAKLHGPIMYLQLGQIPTVVISSARLAREILKDMFVAGTDTTWSTLEWTMTELARHPQVMKKAQQEVRSISSQTGHVDESHLQSFHYLKIVIKEAMRLHPPVPLLVPRESMERCVIDGYEIPAKTRVLINTFSIGRDPNSWDNPLQFNPERFVEGDQMMTEFKDNDFRFLPFGEGRRGCPGYSLALATIELTLARLLYHFDWKLPARVDADKMDLTEIFGLATRKKTPLVLIPTLNKAYPVKEDSDLNQNYVTSV